MRTIFATLLAATIVLVSGTWLFGKENDNHRVQISDLKSGVMCPTESRDQVCESTTKINVTGKDNCILDGEPVPCTWYGFSFRYARLSKPATLNCLWTSSEISSLGNPNETIANDVTESSYQLTLDAKETYFVNPQYSILPDAPYRPDNSTRITNSCSHDGVQLFTVEFKLRYPKN